MKKTISILLALFIIMSLSACGNSASQTEQSSVEGSTNDAASTENKGASKGKKIKVLVAYFSAANTTKGIARHIANGLKADLYEIIPEDSYTDADLDYNDDNSRTTLEMKDSDARPAISGSVKNMEQYDIVFIGYPIWWGDAPRIVANLEQLTNNATWLDGRRLNGTDSQDTIMEWIDSLGLNLKK